MLILTADVMKLLYLLTCNGEIFIREQFNYLKSFFVFNYLNVILRSFCNLLLLVILFHKIFAIKLLPSLSKLSVVLFDTSATLWTFAWSNFFITRCSYFYVLDIRKGTRYFSTFSCNVVKYNFNCLACNFLFILTCLQCKQDIFQIVNLHKLEKNTNVMNCNRKNTRFPRY